MKKLTLLVLVFLFSFAGVVKAELSLPDLIKKVPALKQGVAYSIADNKLNYISTIEAADWKGVTFEIGYAGAAENTGHKAIAVVSYPILKLKDLGVNIPVLDLVEFNLGLYGGYGRIQLNDGQGDGNNEWDYGISATLLNIKF